MKIPSQLDQKRMKNKKWNENKKDGLLISTLFKFARLAFNYPKQKQQQNYSSLFRSCWTHIMLHAAVRLVPVVYQRR